MDEYFELTEVQREVLELIVTGATQRNIAHLRRRSEATVKDQIKAICDVAKVNGRKELLKKVRARKALPDL